MADKVTTTKILGIGVEYIDDTATKRKAYIKLSNPKTSLTQSQITNAANYYLQNIITKENDEHFDSDSAVVFTAYRETEKKTELDID